MLKMNLQLFSSKKGLGSTKNGRDSRAKRLGTKIHPGVNVGKGGDDTLFAKVSGVVRFERKGRDKKQVSIYPV